MFHACRLHDSLSHPSQAHHVKARFSVSQKFGIREVYRFLFRNMDFEAHQMCTAVCSRSEMELSAWNRCTEKRDFNHTIVKIRVCDLQDSKVIVNKILEERFPRYPQVRLRVSQRLYIWARSLFLKDTTNQKATTDQSPSWCGVAQKYYDHFGDLVPEVRGNHLLRVHVTQT